VVAILYLQIVSLKRNSSSLHLTSIDRKAGGSYPLPAGRLIVEKLLFPAPHACPAALLPLLEVLHREYYHCSALLLLMEVLHKDCYNLPGLSGNLECVIKRILLCKYFILT